MIVQIAIPDLKKPPAVKFPERCVNCGKPKEEMLGMSLHMGVQHRNKPVTLELKVPVCKACADRERSVAKVTLIPFFVVGLIFGAIAFVPAMLIAPEGPTPETAGFPFVFGGGVGLVVGMIAGTIAEVIVKSLAVPFYGKLITRRPLTMVSFLAETDELIGVSVKFLREKKLVQLEFENEEIAREFIQLNQSEIQ
ncbi:MAG: hypothetical protein KJZ72_07470 [Anaerolineales bacterium]|nr:hypothetical protein [Anaerolineales bacterium]